MEARHKHEGEGKKGKEVLIVDEEKLYWRVSAVMRRGGAVLEKGIWGGRTVRKIYRAEKKRKSVRTTLQNRNKTG